MKRMKHVISSLIIIAMISLTLSSCYTSTYVVNDGAQGINQVQQKQWYALWGLVPMNDVNAKTMANGHENYTITDQHTFVDFVIGIFTSMVSIVPKTIKVQY